jgi:ADP-glucose pyrophosphorylase
MTFIKSTHLMIKMQTYLYMFMIYVLNIGTITFYYIANLTCIATWPKYTIFGWGCHMELFGKRQERL